MMPALSIRQPWAWLITHGYKDVENRTWATPFRGTLLVHAGKTLTRRYYDDTCASLRLAGLLPSDMPSFDALKAETGGIVGVANVVNCVETSFSPWKQDNSHGFVMSDARPLAMVPWVGRLGFFNVPNDVVRI
ncbi:hypothetical protein BH10PSE18_BH10PSE18_14930 [soil metagenome]